DLVHAVVRQQAHFLAHLPGAVRLAIVKVPGKLNIWSHSGHSAGAPGDRDIRASNKHAWTHNIATIDRVAKSNIVERAINADITHAGEAGFKCDARIPH